jgi:hypothetical protein
MFDEFDLRRRQFFGAAAMTLAASQLGLAALARPQPARAEARTISEMKPGTSKSFGPLKRWLRGDGPQPWSRDPASARVAL